MCRWHDLTLQCANSVSIEVDWSFKPSPPSSKRFILCLKKEYNIFLSVTKREGWNTFSFFGLSLSLGEFSFSSKRSSVCSISVPWEKTTVSRIFVHFPLQMFNDRSCRGCKFISSITKRRGRSKTCQLRGARKQRK